MNIFSKGERPLSPRLQNWVVSRDNKEPNLMSSHKRHHRKSSSADKVKKRTKSLRELPVFVSSQETFFVLPHSHEKKTFLPSLVAEAEITRKTSSPLQVWNSFSLLPRLIGLHRSAISGLLCYIKKEIETTNNDVVCPFCWQIISACLSNMKENEWSERLNAGKAQNRNVR